MEFTELIQTRRSCRAYTGESIAREEIEKLIEQACLSASACNSQPWHFSVLLSPEKKALGAEAVTVIPGANTFAANAAALVVLSEDEEPKLFPRAKEFCGSHAFSQMDVGSAAAYFTLAAANAGYGTCIMGVFDKAKIIEAAGLPDSEIPRLVIALGVIADGDRPHVKKRAPYTEKSRFC